MYILYPHYNIYWILRTLRLAKHLYFVIAKAYFVVFVSVYGDNFKMADDVFGELIPDEILTQSV